MVVVEVALMEKLTPGRAVETTQFRYQRFTGVGE